MLWSLEMSFGTGAVAPNAARRVMSADVAVIGGVMVGKDGFDTGKDIISLQLNHEAIAAAKAGVIGLMQSAAASYASRGIRINAVAPGLVKTEMTRRIWSSEKSASVSRSMHALGRLGEPKDVASLIVWLLQPENDWVTGQVFGVDGGLGTLRVSHR